MKIYLTSQVTEGLLRPHFLNVVPEHVTSGISKPNYFFTSIYPLLIAFATKFYLRSEICISYKFYAGYHQKRDFLRRKRHARFRSVFFI